MIKIRTYSFSLLTLFLLTTIAALVVSHFAKEKRYRELEAEIQLCREKFGYVKITDPSLIHITPFKEQGKHKQLYRIYVPPGHFHMLNIAEFGNDSADRPDDPAPSRTIVLHTWKQGADSVLEFSIDRDSKQKLHCRFIENGIEHIDYRLKSAGRDYSALTQLDKDKVTTFRPNERIELLSFDLNEEKKRVVVWLEPSTDWYARENRLKQKKQ